MYPYANRQVDERDPKASRRSIDGTRQNDPIIFGRRVPLAIVVAEKAQATV